MRSPALRRRQEYSHNDFANTAGGHHLLLRLYPIARGFYGIRPWGEWSKKTQEDKTMLYSKPKLVPLASAVELVQGINAKKGSSLETDQMHKTPVSAYEADE